MKKTSGKDDNRLQDMDEDSSGDENEKTTNSNTQMQPPMPPIPDKVVVKKYDPKQGNALLSSCEYW